MNDSKPRLVAHRGLAARRPENTLLAVRAAIEAGARFVEIDVQLSQDGVPYLLHDRTLERMCAAPGALHEYTSVRLKGLRAGESGKFGGTYADEPLARLSDFAELLTSYGDVFAFVEIKRIAVEQFGVARVVDAVRSAIEAISHRCALISFDVPVLAEVRERTPFPVGPVLETWEQRLQRAVVELDAEYAFINYEKVPASERFELGQAEFIVYEVDDADLALALHERGAEFVETFAIDELAASLNLARRTDSGERGNA